MIHDAQLVQYQPYELEQLFLEDGRRLTYATYGDPSGQPVLFFHGGNDSRLAGRLLAETAQKQNIWLIAPDRPGYGRSDFQPDRQFTDWAKDVQQLADHLQLEQFVAMGHSGGGPHVAAVAALLPERVKTAVFVSSAAPPGSANSGLFIMFRVANFAMSRSPWLHRKLTNNQVDMLFNKPEQMIQGWRMMSAADGQLFDERPDVAEMILDEMREGVYQGIDGILYEHPLYKRAWGIDLGMIHAPTRIWHGAADVQASPAWSAYLHEKIAHSKYYLLPDEGHFSALINQQAQIFSCL